MKKQQRNAPCACGSGRKYKHCCMKEVQVKEKWHVFADGIQDRLEEFCSGPRFASDVDRAFRLYSGPSGDINPAEEGSMREWYIHDHVLERYGRASIELFTDEHLGSFSDLEAGILAGWAKAPRSLYEVTGISKGTGFTARDVFDGTEYFVHDSNASFTLVEHAYVFTRLYNTGEVVITSGLAELIVPEHKKRIVKFVRRNIAKAGHADYRRYLKENSLAVILFIRMLHSTPPLFTTGEGDPVSIAKARYRVNAPCSDICEMLDMEDEFLHVESVDGRHTYNMIEERNELGDAPKTEGTDAVVMKVGAQVVCDGKAFGIVANVEFDEFELLVECISDQRLHKARAVMEEILDSDITHEGDEIMDVESALRDASRRE